jgi:ferrochelatase
MLGVLLLAHGGPSSLEDVPAFLEQVRGGRPCPERLVDGVRERYRCIGGASPLPVITQRTATKLENACGLPTYVGMLHWHPFLEDTVSRMLQDGISRALVICLVPHFSQCSVGRYHGRAASAASERGLALDLIESWHTLPPYIDGLADSVIAARKKLRHDPATQTRVIFSAHSLPKAALPAGDPYEAQLLETARQVAARLEMPEEAWAVAYQRASGPGQEWLGPSVDELILALPEQDVDQVVLCPFGFLADQVEILYDLDVLTKQKAEGLGVAVARTQLLNDGPALIDSLALLVDQWKAQYVA